MGHDTLTHQTCTDCNEVLTDDNSLPSRRARGIRQCTPCANRRRNEHRIAYPHQTIFTSKRCRAKSLGREFTLKFEDIVWPTHCPALGIELEYRRQRSSKTGPLPNSPSFDRIDPSKGYVPGNVIIVSHLANVIKTNATVDQLKKVAAFYEQLIPHVGDTHASEDHRVVPQPVAG